MPQKLDATYKVAQKQYLQDKAAWKEHMQAKAGELKEAAEKLSALQADK